MFKGKRGAVVESETIHVTGLIILIAILIVIYMFLIPPEARKDILDGGEIDEDSGTTDRESGGKNYVLESPGVLFSETEETDQIKFPSVNLFSKNVQKVTTLASSVFVSRSLLNDEFRDLSFKLDNSENINKLRLFFNIIDSKGDLLIYLNGKLVFKGKPSTQTMPLEIPTSNLDAENTLRIAASSPTWRFLSVNKFELKDLRLIREEISENKKELRSFSIDKDKIKTVELNYFINCLRDTDNQGLLKIFLNDFNVHLGQVICDAEEQVIDVPEEYFEDGQNMMTFEKDFGDFIIEQIALEIELEGQKAPTYFFDVDEEDLDEEFSITLDLVPNEDDERSSATILINSERITLDTERNIFSKDISAFIEEGENFVKIIPRNEFEIISLEVFSE